MAAGKERDRLEREMRRRVASVAQDLVIEPVERELTRYNDYFAALETSRR